MLQTFLLCIVIIALCVLMLCVRMILKKDGRFVKTHVSQNPYMREKGVGCIQSQDYAERHRRKLVKE